MRGGRCSRRVPVTGCRVQYAIAGDEQPHRARPADRRGRHLPGAADLRPRRRPARTTRRSTTCSRRSRPRSGGRSSDEVGTVAVRRSTSVRSSTSISAWNSRQGARDLSWVTRRRRSWALRADELPAQARLLRQPGAHGRRLTSRGAAHARGRTDHRPPPESDPAGRSRTAWCRAPARRRPRRHAPQAEARSRPPRRGCGRRPAPGRPRARSSGRKCSAGEPGEPARPCRRCPARTSRAWAASG